MRKSYDDLSALVWQALREDPLSGDLFAFVNWRRIQMRVPYFAGDGFYLVERTANTKVSHWPGYSYQARLSAADAGKIYWALPAADENVCPCWQSATGC